MLFVYDDNAVHFDGHQFMFRKDVLYTVAEIVQRGMLQLAPGISCTIAECTGTYPILTSDCLHHTKTCLIGKQYIFDSDIVDGRIEHDRMPDERYRDSINSLAFSSCRYCAHDQRGHGACLDSISQRDCFSDSSSRYRTREWQ
jgi:hypothetical protein